MSVPAVMVEGQVEDDRLPRLLEEVSAGASLRKACAGAGITIQSFLRRTVANADLAEQYVRARISQASVHADEILEIADNEELDARSRAVRIEARKWIASKLHPKLYGDRLHAEVTGKDGAPLGAQLDAGAVIDGLVSLATEHPIAAIPLRALLQQALDRIPVPT